MTSVSKNVYFDKLNDIVNKCNDTYHGTLVWRKFCDKKLETLKALLRRHMLLVILKVEKLLEHFMKTNCRKKIKESLKLKE